MLTPSVILLPSDVTVAERAALFAGCCLQNRAGETLHSQRLHSTYYWRTKILSLKPSCLFSYHRRDQGLERSKITCMEVLLDEQIG